MVVLAQFVSRTFLHDGLQLYNVVLNTRNVPSTWNDVHHVGKLQKSVHIFKSSEVKSCQAKKSSRVKSNPVKSSQLKSSQVSAHAHIREANVRAEAEKKNIFTYVYIYIYTPKTVQPQASLRERESSI